MTKRELQRYTKMDTELKRIEEQMDRLESQLINPKIPTISDMPRGGQCADMGDKIVKLIDLKNLYNKRWDKLIDERMRIEKVIDSLEDSTERALIGYKYIDGLTWEEVCVKINYSYRHTTRLHGEILNKMRGI